MPSAKTSSGLGLVRHATTLRLTRIATLVVGSLVFLYACEVSRKSDLSDVWLQVFIAAGLALTGLVTAWFEVRAADHAATRARTEIRGFLIESDGLSVRARITRSGDLVFHGHDSSGAYPAYEWDWAFRATSFPAIRAALGGGSGDLLELLERTVPHWDDQDRYDPGSWLHNQGIPAAFRERGDTSNRITRVLPVIKPEHPPAQPNSAAAHHATPSRNATRELSNPRVPPHSRTGESPDQVRPERSRRRRAEPPHEQDAPANARRRPAANPHRSEPPSDSWHDQPATRYDEPPRRRNQPPNMHRNEPPSERWDEPPATRHRQSPNGYAPSEARGYEPPAARYGEPPTDHRSRGTHPGDPSPAGRRTQPPTPHRPALSGAHSESPRPHQPQSPPPRRNDPPNTRHRR